MSEETTERKTVHYPCQLATKVDWETIKELDDISLYEKKKRATLVRDIVLDKIKVYERNPAYKRFKNQLELMRQKETRGGE